MDTPRGGRARGLRPRMRLPGPDAASPALNWVGGERIAIGSVPSARLVARPAEQGVTHIVNCRSRPQVRWSGDLAAERAAFGPGRVAHAPMQDHGLRQRPAVWAAAACFAAQVLTEQQQAGVLIHCSAGRRRSPMLACAVLRLRGHAPRAGGRTRAELPNRGRTGSGLCPQRQAVARHGSPVTSAMPDRKGIRRAVPPWRVRLRMERRRERVPNLPNVPICSRSTFSRKATSPYHA
jgi:hypothetical protein